MWQAFVTLIYSLPLPLRYEIRGRLWREMEARRGDGRTADIAALEQAWRDMEVRMAKSGVAPVVKKALAA